MNKKYTVAGLLATSTMMVVAMASPAMAASGAPSPEPAQDNATCVNGHWPGVTDGRPTQLEAGAEGAVYAWHDDTGWHLRATHAGNGKQVISGKITSDGAIYAVARHTEGRDRVAHSASRHTVAFRFTNYGHIDGLDFKVRCGNHLRFNGQDDGTQLTPGQVWIGHNNDHPTSVPFEIDRVQP